MAASASDWSCRVGNFLQPIRNTIQILVVNVIRMEFLRSFLRLHFAVKPEVASQNVGCFLRHDTQVLFMRGFRFRSKACSWLPPKGRRRVDRQPTPKHLRRTQSKPLLPRVQAWTQHLSALGLTIGNPVNLVSAPFKELITCGAKLLNADWLRQRAFFLKIKRAILVIKRALLLDADWI